MKTIKSMLLLFVAATITHTPALAQLSYSLPPAKIVEPAYSLPNYPNQQLSRSVQPKEDLKVDQTAKVEKQEDDKVVRKGPDIVFKNSSNSTFPRVPYPTMAIGQFMSFCSNAMMRRFQQGAAQGQRINPQMEIARACKRPIEMITPSLDGADSRA